MSQVSFKFTDYPAFRFPRQRTQPDYFSGHALCVLNEPLRAVLTSDEGRKILVPFQRPIQWKVMKINLAELPPQTLNFNDAARFIRGRYGARIQCLLTAQMLRDEGEAQYAEIFQRLADGKAR